MQLLDIFQTTLPLTNPILKFLLILVIILFAPIILNKIKIPHLLGLIIAGAIIGPNGINLMERDSSIILSGTAGLLYIMFLAGLEIDLGDFKKNSKKSLIFGLLTFIIPMTLGTLSGVYILKFSVPTSVLLASMFASHTLIAYPLISKMGVAKNKAVNITVGGTLITDTLALLVLAVIVGMTTGEVNAQFWLRLSLSILVFGMIVMLLFPIIGRWFFKRFDDNVSQYIFVLVMVYLGAVLAEMAGIEAIIGAFLAGLALNRLIPHTSPLMNRVEFVGNAIFIPFFLIGVGMLIDYRAFFKDLDTIWVASVMIAVATSAKFIAAWITQKSFKFSKDERRLIFGLSNAQAAATLAAVFVGYNIILNQSEIDQALLIGEVVEPKRLLNDAILNGTILMILFTCTIASFVAQKGAKNIALLESSDETEKEHESAEKILIPISNIEITDELVNLGVTVKSKKNKNGLFALSIVDNNTKDSTSDKNAKKILDRAAVTASATDNQIHELLRYDLNIVNGISSVIREHKITDLILGLHSQKGISNSFLGNLTEGILTKCNTTTLIYKPAQPFATIKRHLIIVPENAEKEIGFPFWLIKLWNIARNSGAKLVFYAGSETILVIQEIQSKHPIQCEFEEFSDWEDFLILSRNVQDDDNLIIILSRKDKPSFQQQMTKMPQYLNKYFVATSYILIYPMQIGVSDTTKIDLKNPTFIEPFEKLDEIGKTIAKIFKRMK
jgi:Kef-type K+ transport system membrane component KefB/nucleotide-binding universal stress UspA family protein